MLEWAAAVLLTLALRLVGKSAWATLTILPAAGPLILPVATGYARLEAALAAPAFTVPALSLLAFLATARLPFPSARRITAKSPRPAILGRAA
jgi:hypothetical protein